MLALSIIIGLFLISILDYDQMNVVGNFLIGLGGLLIIVASQGSYLAGLQNTQGREAALEKQLSLLQEESRLIQGRLNQMLAR
jgi:hypothetical protein